MDVIEEIKKRFNFLVLQYGFTYIEEEHVWHVDVLHYRKGAIGIGLEYESPWDVTPIFILYHNENESASNLQELKYEYGKSIYDVLYDHNDANYLALLKQSRQIADRGNKRKSKDQLEAIYCAILDIAAQAVDLYLQHYWPEVSIRSVENVQIPKSLRRDSRSI